MAAIASARYRFTATSRRDWATSPQARSNSAHCNGVTTAVWTCRGCPCGNGDSAELPTPLNGASEKEGGGTAPPVAVVVVVAFGFGEAEGFNKGCRTRKLLLPVLCRPPAVSAAPRGASAAVSVLNADST